MEKLQELNEEHKKIIKLFLDSNFVDFRKFLQENNLNIYFHERHISDLNEIAKKKLQPTKNQHYVQQWYLNLFSIS